MIFVGEKMDYKKLSDLCDVVSGGTPARSRIECWENGTIPWVKISDLSSKYIKGTEEKITETGLKESSAKLLPRGTILFSIFATLGATGILDIDASTNQAIAGLTVRDSRTIDPEYLYYYLLSKKTYVNNIGRGVAQNNINLSILKSLEVPVPTVDEQRSIITILNKNDAIITGKRKVLKALNELVKARFVEMFGDPELNDKGWPCKTLGDVLSVEPQNGLYKPQSAYKQDGTGTPIVRIDAFYDGKVTDFNKLRRLVCSDAEKEKYTLQENDIVINRVNSIEYLGKCARIIGMREPTVYESNMMRFHVDETRVDPCFMTRLLCSTFMYRQILNRAKKAVNQASINQSDVQSFTVIIPPIDLQKQFADFVQHVDKSKAAVQKSLDETQLLFDSLMQKYFG